jgi:glucokinase
VRIVPAPTMRAVLGIDIGGTKISLCAVNECGQILASHRIPTRSSDGASAVLERLTGAAKDLVAQIRVGHLAQVCGVGVVTPGVVGADSVKLAPNNHGWEHVALTATIRERLNLDAVEADNDAKAATAAEARWGALAGFSDGLLINLGTGISAGAIVGGQLLRGAHGAALEIAYQVPSDGPLRGFRHGGAPLEDTFSGTGLQARASAMLGRPTGTDEVFEAMTLAAGSDPFKRPGDDQAQLAALGRQALDLAARAIANLAIALDPQIVAVSGGMLGSADQILPRLALALEELVPFPPRLVLAHFAQHAPLAGACLLAYGAARLPVPDDLLINNTDQPSLPRVALPRSGMVAHGAGRPGGRDQSRLGTGPGAAVAPGRSTGRAAHVVGDR